jgi:hypothetical protein
MFEEYSGDCDLGRVNESLRISLVIISPILTRLHSPRLSQPVMSTCGGYGLPMSLLGRLALGSVPLSKTVNNSE